MITSVANEIEFTKLVKKYLGKLGEFTRYGIDKVSFIECINYIAKNGRNENELNNYTKLALEESGFQIDSFSGLSFWNSTLKSTRVENDDETKDIKRSISKLINRNDKNKFIDFYFIFCSLFIAITEEKEFDEKLSMIADFAILLNVEETEIQDICEVINFIMKSDNEHVFILEKQVKSKDDEFLEFIKELIPNWIYEGEL